MIAILDPLRRSSCTSQYKVEELIKEKPTCCVGEIRLLRKKHYECSYHNDESAEILENGETQKETSNKRQPKQAVNPTNSLATEHEIMDEGNSKTADTDKPSRKLTHLVQKVEDHSSLKQGLNTAASVQTTHDMGCESRELLTSD